MIIQQQKKKHYIFTKQRNVFDEFSDDIVK